MFDFNKLLAETEEFGEVKGLRHPVVTVSGLPGARLNEMVIFESGQKGQVFLIERDANKIVLLDKHPVKVSTKVARTNKFLSLPVGEELLGQVIDPLGEGIFENFKKPKEHRELDAPILGISKRQRINKPFLTGVSLVDLLIPLGKGQRELVIGDRDTGKSIFLLTALKTQVESGSIGVYALIGKSKGEVEKIVKFLEKEKLIDKVVIVSSLPDDSPGLTFLTPFSAMAIAEYFRDQGQDVTLILDDLSTHAKFYREISLISRRFPGRDSYPGDIFYIHAKLLERAGNFKLEDEKQSSITALPVVELVEGDLSGFIATNIIGMTDGHIFFDSELYFQGKRPAINFSLSVTRVGRQTQTPLVRDTNRELMLFLTQYQRMSDLAHMGAELTDEGKRTLRIGQALSKFFEQPTGLNLKLETQLILVGLLWQEFLDQPLINMGIYREKINTALGQTDFQKLAESLTDAESFSVFLDQIYQKREELLELCQLKSK